MTPSIIKNVASGLCAAAMLATPGIAKEKVELIWSSTMSATHYRATMLDTVFGACLGDEFEFTPYHGATLFKQGTELTAMQRGNLDMAPLAIPDLYNQVPESSILSTAYLYSDYDHMRRVWASGVLEDLLATIQDKAGIVVLDNNYIGTRQVNLKGDKVIKTPEDMAGIKLRMPGGHGHYIVDDGQGQDA